MSTSFCQQIRILAAGSAIRGSKTPWAVRMVKLDFVLTVRSGQVEFVFKCDGDNGHSGSRGTDISKFGILLKYDRDLHAELMKTKSVASALGDLVCYIR